MVELAHEQIFPLENRAWRLNNGLEKLAEEIRIKLGEFGSVPDRPKRKAAKAAGA